MAPKILVLFLLAAGCAGLNPRPVARADDDAELKQAQLAAKERKLVCTVERPTGSNIAERVCRHKDDVAENAARTQETLLTMPRTTPCGGDKCAGGGGSP
jgi:hypothetical protein